MSDRKPKSPAAGGIPLTAEAIPEEGPLSAAQSMTLCAGCVRCCTYVSVEVDAPTSPWQYDQYIWLLYHRGVWMYLEKGNHWYVQFETVCGKLAANGHCTVHGRHPALCKDYDPRSCERRGELTDQRARWFDGEELVAWMEKERPAHYKRWKAWFDKQHEPRAYGHAPAQVRDEGASKRGNLRRRATRRATKGAVRFEMPPPPVNPLLEVEKEKPRG